MTGKELKIILEDMLSRMRSFNTEIRSINETLDKTLKLFKNSEERPVILQEVLSK